MTLESRPPHFFRTALLGAVLAIVSAACSGDDAVATTMPPPPTTTAAPTTTTTTLATTTTAPEVTTTAPVTTPPSPDTVGDPEQLQALIDSISEEVEGFYEVDDLGMPAFDLTTLDPVRAVEELNRLDQWIAANYPYPGWTPLEAISESPSADLLDRVADSMFADGERRIRPGDPWVFFGGTVVDPATLTLPDDITEGMPADAVAVLYESESGPLQVIVAETGQVNLTIDGWERRTSLSIVAPTSSGWKFWATVTDYDAGGT